MNWASCALVLCLEKTSATILRKSWDFLTIKKRKSDASWGLYFEGTSNHEMLLVCISVWHTVYNKEKFPAWVYWPNFNLSAKLGGFADFFLKLQIIQSFSAKQVRRRYWTEHREEMQQWFDRLQKAQNAPAGITHLHPRGDHPALGEMLQPARPVLWGRGDA